MTLGGLIRRSTARRYSPNRLPDRRLNRLLVLEPLESRLCPVLTLTQAGINAGFVLSTFATDIGATNTVGPLGIAFPDSGGVLIDNYPGYVGRFASDTDGQSGARVSDLHFYGGANAADLAMVGANIYMTQQQLGRVVQINDDGTFEQVIATNLPAATGMVADPANGHLFVDDNLGGGQVVDIDPLMPSVRPFQNTGILDGLAITPDGRILFGANRNNGHIVGYDTVTAKKVFDSVNAIPGDPDGIALGTGAFVDHLYVNTNGGTLVDLDMATLTQTVIANQGSRGDFVTMDPNNGSLLVTQSTRIERLTFPPGPASSFRIAASPNFVAGRPFGVSVTVLDSYGAVATGYTGTVRFASTDPYPGLLPLNYTFTPSDNGTHIFGAVFFTAGTQTLTAQDTANPSITGSATVTVDAAPASHISLTAPSTAVAGSSFDVTVAGALILSATKIPTTPAR